MAERYTRIYSLEGPCWVEGLPLLIQAGALLEDGYSGELVCQLKLQSLSEKPIKAATVRIRMLDIAGQPLTPTKSYQYLDLALQRGEVCGQNTAIILPRRDARAFSVTLCQVIFADNSRWEAEETLEWKTLPPLRSLAEHYGDAQLAEQFRIRYGSDCTDIPQETEELWYCTCGAVNFPEENHCARCRRVRSALLNVNTESLRQEVATRLKQEELRSAEDKVANKKRMWKDLKLAGILIPIVILALGLLKTVPGYVRQQQNYDRAIALLAAGRYELAAEAFDALNGYRDSREQLEKNLPYQRAIYIMERAKANDASALSLVGRSRADLSEDVSAAMLLYQGAIAEFEALGDYKNCAEQIALCRDGIEQARLALRQREYEQALELLEARHYSKAHQAFLALGDFSDSAEMAKEASYRKAEALYGFIQNHDVRQVYASLSMAPDRGSSFSLAKETALTQGNQYMRDLRVACGGDLTDLSFSDEPGASQRPLADCVTEMFEQLEGYRESEACIQGIRDATDYSQDFFMLCEAGELRDAQEWLQGYEGKFDERERWEGLLELYLPFCARWTIHGGDVTAIPYTVDRKHPCNSFSTKVILDQERATLRITANDGEDYFVDLYADLGENRFSLRKDNDNSYLLVIGASGRLAYMNYDALSHLRTSCEYLRA